MVGSQIDSILANEGEQLAPVVKRLWLIQWILATVIFVPLVYFAEWRFLAKELPGFPIGLGTALFFLVFRLPGLLLLPKTYENWRFVMNSQFVSTGEGVLGRQVKTLPLPRLQYVDVQSSMLENALGIATISVYAAGAASPVIAIPGITRERADRFRADVLRLKGEQDGV